ncbi:MAG: beta galactosidase jelly roll domain-containing protein [Lentisphaeria bacterium]|nr:beta galactosidase jelly roll domain-containing protein [Lentisphaeria bacterium]
MNKLFASFAAVLIASGAYAALEIDPVFSSDMVLQQQRPITFFGTADQGASVKIEFDGKTVTAKAGDGGKWEAAFPAMKAGKTNYTVRISDGKSEIELKDVLIGEVWFCSGQSNMQLQIGKTFKRGSTAQNCEEEVANAKYPEIRYALQKRCSSPGKRVSAQYSYAKSWVKCSPETAYYFSAAAYFFGRELHRDLNVPVGLIVSSWGGTMIQPWLSLEGFRTAGIRQDFKGMEEFFDGGEEGRKSYEAKEQKRYSDAMRKWQELFEKAGAEARKKAHGWETAGFDDSAWAPAVRRYSTKYLVRWYRAKFKVRDIMKGKKVVFNMEKGGDKAEVWLNGKKIAGWETYNSEDEKKIRLEITPDQLDQEGENTLAVRSVYLYGWKSASQMDKVIADAHFSMGKRLLLLRNKWKMNDEFSCTDMELSGKRVPQFISYKEQTTFPTCLYNGMVDPWTKLPVRGVIWYQGCSNVFQKEHYYPLLKALIADWRTKWNAPELPFLIVQLAGYDPGRAKTWQTADPNTPYGNALTRDIQQQMLELPNVGLACTIDIGEADNIHPGNKQDVGKRLALEAERIACGKKIVSRGPLFEAAKPEKDSIRVFFRYAENGLKTSDGKAPGAFAIAGADRKFVWAEAKIEGKTVVVSSPAVKEPRYVRYAYAGYRGDCNLQNAEGLPAYPFRSDAVDYSKVK